jgi:hypothetical protein
MAALRSDGGKRLNPIYPRSIKEAGGASGPREADGWLCTGSSPLVSAMRVSRSH